MTELQRKILEEIISQPRPAGLIAQQVRCSIQSVLDTAKRLGVELPKGNRANMSAESRAKLSESMKQRRAQQRASRNGSGHPPCERAYVLAQFGYTTSELAARYGVTTATVEKWIETESAKATA